MQQWSLLHETLAAQAAAQIPDPQLMAAKLIVLAGATGQMQCFEAMRGGTDLGNGNKQDGYSG